MGGGVFASQRPPLAEVSWAEVAPRPAHGSRGLGLGQERIESRAPAGAVFLGPGAPAAEQGVCRTPQAARGPGPGLATSRPGGKWRVPSRWAQVFVPGCVEHAGAFGSQTDKMPALGRPIVSQRRGVPESNCVPGAGTQAGF